MWKGKSCLPGKHVTLKVTQRAYLDNLFISEGNNLLYKNQIFCMLHSQFQSSIFSKVHYESSSSCSSLFPWLVLLIFHVPIHNHHSRNVSENSGAVATTLWFFHGNSTRKMLVFLKAYVSKVWPFSAHWHQHHLGIVRNANHGPSWPAKSETLEAGPGISVLMRALHGIFLKSSIKLENDWIRL